MRAKGCFRGDVGGVFRQRLGLFSLPLPFFEKPNVDSRFRGNDDAGYDAGMTTGCMTVLQRFQVPGSERMFFTPLPA